MFLFRSIVDLLNLLIFLGLLPNMGKSLLVLSMNFVYNLVKGLVSSFAETSGKNSGFLSDFPPFKASSRKEIDVSNPSAQCDVLNLAGSNSSFTVEDEVQLGSWSMSRKENQPIPH